MINLLKLVVVSVFLSHLYVVELLFSLSQIVLSLAAIDILALIFLCTGKLSLLRLFLLANGIQVTF